MTPPKQHKRGRRDVDNLDDAQLNDDTDIKDLLRSLSSKMDSLSDTMSEVNNRLNAKIDVLESSLCKMVREVKAEMDKELSLFSANVDVRINEVIAESNRKCEETAAQVTNNLSNRLDEMSATCEFRLDKLERMSLDKELIITGVPMETNDNPIGIVGDIVQALNCNLQQRDFTSAFRVKRKHTGTSRPVPIVVRVYDNYVKQELLSCYFKKRNLNLQDIGFKTSARIFINESLTNPNREIFNLASEAKKANHIVKLFTRNGLVHVQRYDKDKSVCIQHLSDLEQILPPAFGRTSSITANRGWTHRRLHLNSPADATPLSASGPKTTDDMDIETSTVQSQLPPN